MRCPKGELRHPDSRAREYRGSVSCFPGWFDVLPLDRRKQLADYFLSTANRFSQEINPLKNCPAGFDNWRPEQAFSL